MWLVVSFLLCEGLPPDLTRLFQEFEAPPVYNLNALTSSYMPRCWAEVKYLGWSDGTRYINVVSSPRCMFSVLIQCKNLTVFCQQKASILSIWTHFFFCHCFCYLMLFQMLLFYLKDLSVLKGLFTLRIVGNIIDFLYLRL